jgi:hypothetical protein
MTSEQFLLHSRKQKRAHADISILVICFKLPFSFFLFLLIHFILAPSFSSHIAPHIIFFPFLPSFSVHISLLTYTHTLDLHCIFLQLSDLSRNLASFYQITKWINR